MGPWQPHAALSHPSRKDAFCDELATEAEVAWGRSGPALAVWSQDDTALSLSLSRLICK